MIFKEFFYLQKSDRKVVLVFLTVIVVALSVIYIVGGKNSRTPVSESDADSSDSIGIYQDGAHHNYDVNGNRAELFPFDPNTADSTQLLRLGLQPWQVRNIYKYRAAGGVYRSPSDFARLYGLTVKQYREMRPYIHISTDYAPASEVYQSGDRSSSMHQARYERDTLRYPVKIKLTEHIALNIADTSSLKKVPGIGSSYARAIARYRERLGGFYSVEQLREIEGFPEESMRYFTLGTDNIRKININRLSLSQLRRHPYITFYMAKNIVEYRRLRGPIHSLQDLRLLQDFSPSVILRLQPYVEF